MQWLRSHLQNYLLLQPVNKNALESRGKLTRFRVYNQHLITKLSKCVDVSISVKNLQ